MKLTISISGLLVTSTLAATACVEPEAADDAAPLADAADEAAVPTALINTPAGVRRVAYREVAGRAIYDGDIDLGPVSELQLFGGAVIADLGKRWPNGQVRYFFGEGMTTARRDAVRAVLADLHARAPLTFIELQSSPSGAYIEYRSVGSLFGTGGSSAVGMQGGAQVVNLVDPPGDVETTPDLIEHETLHALGLFHEQARNDRDQFITVNSTCLDPILAYNYGTHSDSLDVGLYDLSSIMHYPTGTFCASPVPAGCSRVVGTTTVCLTMTLKNGVTIGRNFLRSRDDLNTLWRMYAPSLDSDEVDDNFGKAVAIGDFDDDGYGDVAIGVPGETIGGLESAGRVHVMRGTSTGLVPWQEIDQDDTGTFAIEAGDRFGAALAAGDVDRDGIDDLLIGSPYETIGTTSQSGAAMLMKGGETGLTFLRSYTQQSLGLSSETIADHFGQSVAIAAIGGNDWQRAVLIGAPNEHNGAVRNGAVFVHALRRSGLGAASTKYKIADETLVGGAHFGETIAVGNLADGGATSQSVAIGAPAALGRGAVYVYTGRTPTLAAADATNPLLTTFRSRVLPPSSTTDDFGAALAVANSHGTLTSRDELVIGAPGTLAGAGAVYVYEQTSSTSALTFLLTSTLTQSELDPSEAGDRFGAVLAAGDMLQSTLAELAVGVPGEDGGAGAVAVFRGRDTGETPEAFFRDSSVPFEKNEAEDGFGSAVAIGNIDGIGGTLSTASFTNPTFIHGDLVVGVPGEGYENAVAPTFEGPLGGGTVKTFLSTGGALTTKRAYRQSSRN